jgi:hypothetical protein
MKVGTSYLLMGTMRALSLKSLQLMDTASVSPMAKAIQMRLSHGEFALTQARQMLALTDITQDGSYWEKVIEILSRK